jgi:tyramine---L-glutamate ligase
VLRVLCAEYLLGVPEAWSRASASMQREAAAMLSAVIEDFGRLGGCEIAVLIGDGHQAAVLGAVPDDSVQLVTVRDAGEFETELSQQSRNTDVVFLIAPECDGILSHLLQTIRRSARTDTQILNADQELVECFSDKLATFHWLQNHQLPAIPTWGLNDPSLQLNQLTPNAVSNGSLFVVKPRSGAGSEEVRVIDCWNQSRDLFSADPDRSGDYILQPYVEGISCSMGFLGGGSACRSMILPPAQQIIEFRGGFLKYQGSIVPCQPELHPAIEPFAHTIAAALGSFSGYIGVDFIVKPNSENPFQIVEVNPRLCTSYLAYRRLTECNLIDRMLSPRSDVPISWKPAAVSFRFTENTGEFGFEIT